MDSEFDKAIARLERKTRNNFIVISRNGPKILMFDGLSKVKSSKKLKWEDRTITVRVVMIGGEGQTFHIAGEGEEANDDILGALYLYLSPDGIGV